MMSKEKARESASELGTGATVHPYIIVTLGQSAHHDKLLVYNGYTRYTLDNFGGIFVLCFGNLLGGYAALYH